MMKESISMHNTLIENLGIEICDIKNDGTCIATMPVNERTKQPFGLLHGGASVALAETVASIGAASLINQETHLVFGQEINANHIQSKQDGMVTATASVVHQGKFSMVYEIRIEDETQQLICISRCTLAVIPRKK